MDRILYTAMNGAARTLEHQAALANNMANANTPGFRAQLALYRSVPLQGGGVVPTRVSTVASTPGSHFEPGALRTTGNPLDVAIADDGWFAVQTADGGEAYTRAGSFKVSADGQLQTSAGLPVLSADGAAIDVPPMASLTIAADGAITALLADDTTGVPQALAQLKRVNPDAKTLTRGDDGLFRVLDADGKPQSAPDAPEVRLVAGAVEDSNVNPAEVMVGLIDNARRFEMQMKAIQNADQNAQHANQILGTS